MKRATIKDIENVNRILTDDSVFPYISDDGAGIEVKLSLAYIYLSNPVFYVLLQKDHTCFVLIPKNFITYEIHTNILPEGRGKTAFESGRKVLEWMFTNTNCQKIVSCVPSFNRKTAFYAVKCGLMKEGTSTKSFLKNGKLYDLELFGITKERWILCH